MSNVETVSYIINKRCSVARFGNGEMDIMLGDNKGFQKFDPSLASELLAIKSSSDLLVCVPVGITKYRTAAEYSEEAASFWSRYYYETSFFWKKRFRKERKLGDTNFTRFYMDFSLKDREAIDHYIRLVKMIWDAREIAIIEGELSRLGVGNDLFSNAKNVVRILCPAKNAYECIDAIEKFIEKKIKKTTLLLLALGPSATCLAARLSKKGWQAIDLGHIDIEYEWFLKGASTKEPVQGKYVNELPGHEFSGTIDDLLYQKQIVGHITKKQNDTHTLEFTSFC